MTLLTRVRAGGSRAEQATRELARLGPEAAPEILGLSSGRVTELGPLAPDERELLLDLLRSWPADRAAAALAAALPPAATLDDRLAALSLVGAVGGRAAIEAVRSLCADLSPEQYSHPVVSRAVEQTLLLVLRSDARAYDELGRMLERDQLGASLGERVAAALASSGLGRGLPLLQRMLGSNRQTDRIVLAAIGGLRPFDDARAVVRASDAARRYLSSIHPELRRQAALALGSLHDGEAVPDLLALLEDGDARVRRGAGMALSQIAGLDASAQPDWTGWFEAELGWLESEGSRLLEDLAASDVARAVAALRILSMHPLHRSAVAERIQALLQHEEPVVASAACAALAKLGDVTAFEPLVSALEDEREAVRAAAQGALMTLTGATVEPEPEAWRAWLEPAQA